jgi:hypothetical protein
VTMHPAHQIAEMAANAAGEPRGYLNPADPFPWELTDDDHRALLPRLRGAIADLAVCIDGIAQMTADRDARRQLTEGAARLIGDCEQIGTGKPSSGRTDPARCRGPGRGPRSWRPLGSRSPWPPRCSRRRGALTPRHVCRFPARARQSVLAIK